MVDRPLKKPLPMFALRLRRARLNTVYKGKTMTQVQAAALIGVGSATYWRWEAGLQMPGYASVVRIAEVLGVKSDEMWLDVGFIPPDMQEFLVMTREGGKVVQNIRAIMETMEKNQKPTTRRDAPIAEKFVERLRSNYHDAYSGARKRVKNRREHVKRRVNDMNMKEAKKA